MANPVAVKQSYRSFENSEVIVTTCDDKRLACISDALCRYEQAHDGPTFVVIRPGVTDGQLLKVSERFGLDIEHLRTFRATEAV